MSNYIRELKNVKQFFDKDTYRKTLARAYVLHLKDKYKCKQIILEQTNLFLEAEGLKPISYGFVRLIVDKEN